MFNAYLLAAILIGAAFACQPAINSVAASALGSAYPATVISVAVTLLVSIAVMVGTGTTPNIAAVATLPWWIVLGGVIGVLVVAGGVAIAPVTGIAVFFVCMIFGQLVGSILLDHYGAFGLEVREISLPRVAGVLLTFGGILLVRFAG